MKVLSASDLQNLPPANLRYQPRVTSLASASTVYGNHDLYDLIVFTALAVNLTINDYAGGPVNGEQKIIRIKSDASAHTLTWNSIYISSGIATLPTTTVASKTITVGIVYDSTAAKWVCLAVDASGY